ncbi:MAG: transketolase C-terminal domain-containing protein, partial [Actinomycetota bacterium]
LIARGSELSLCVEAAGLLARSGISVRVVSMPSVTRFLHATSEYRSTVLPSGIPTISVEAGSTFGWSSVADHSIGIDRFGLSAPAPAVFDALGITVEAIVALATTIAGGGK